MPEGPNFSQTLTNLSSNFPGAASGSPAPVQSISAEIQTLLSNPLAVGETIQTTTSVNAIALARIAANRAVAEVLTNIKDATGATFLVETVATFLSAAAGAVLDRAVSIGYLRTNLIRSLGAWAVNNNQSFESQTGSNNAGFGLQAGQFTSSTSSVFGGIGAGQFSSGASCSYWGHQSGQYSTGTQSQFRGFQAGQYNTAANCVIDGALAGRFNSGLGLTASGHSAGRHNTGDSNTAVGSGSWNVAADTPAAVSFANAAINVGTQTITVTSTAGIGTVGKRYPMRAALTTGTLPTGLTAGSDYSVLVLSSTQLQLLDSTITDAGSGTFTLTPFVGRAFTNTTVVGAGAVPTASNEVVLGNPSVNQLTTAATRIRFGTIPTYASDNAADTDSALPSGHLYRIGTGRTLFQKP